MGERSYTRDGSLGFRGFPTRGRCSFSEESSRVPYDEFPLVWKAFFPAMEHHHPPRINLIVLGTEAERATL